MIKKQSKNNREIWEFGGIWKDLEKWVFVCLLLGLILENNCDE
jgi:hypothetical protein